MNLRVKTLLAVCVTLAVLLIALYAGAEYALARRAARAEEAATRAAMRRVQKLLGEEHVELLRQAKEWATQPRVHAAFERTYQDLGAEIAWRNTLGNLRLDYALVMDAAGRVQFGRTYDAAIHQLGGLKPELLAYLEERPELWSQNDSNSGMVRLPRTFTVFGMSPIAGPPLADGPRRYLIFGR